MRDGQGEDDSKICWMVLFLKVHLCGCLIYTVTSQACSSRITDPPRIGSASQYLTVLLSFSLSFDALTFVCSSSEHQQGMHFRKLYPSSRVTPSGMFYAPAPHPPPPPSLG